MHFHGEMANTVHATLILACYILELCARGNLSDTVKGQAHAAINVVDLRVVENAAQTHLLCSRCSAKQHNELAYRANWLVARLLLKIIIVCTWSIP